MSPPRFYDPYLRQGKISIVFGKTYRLLQQSHAALVTSGTATLETALLRVPQVVGYFMRGGQFTYLLFRPFIKVDYISLVNLIADAPVVKELLVHHFSVENARRALEPLLGVDTRARARHVERLRRGGSPSRKPRSSTACRPSHCREFVSLGFILLIVSASAEKRGSVQVVPLYAREMQFTALMEI